ncbi:LacI family DNA-binding transcriptional regulator [Puia dinghuensis]|uniref:LacI family transcriptional regulator n=1 Tax=Puia dinghuensis TaxID=1792502 RepID=A0A8J2UHD7_9BACT|nr:LacI family DNA-binding transcriptional regulator [Puia dinghuensis]GGB17736.1 LacI family transcriptional regulator [Puia dinghuensis]
MKDKLPTIKEIARQLNVSISTVSRALHDHPGIGLRTKMRVQQLARQLEYEPNQTAIFFKQRKTFTIGVVLPNLGEEFFSQAINGIEEIATQNKYSVLIGQSKDDVARERQIVTTMKNNRIDGLIVSLSKNTTTYDHFTALKKFNIPVVFFDRVPTSPDFNKVYSNMNSGTREAIEFLIDKGHRRIGVINGPDQMRSSRERTETYKQVLIARRLKIDLRLVTSTDLTKEGTQRAMQHLLSQRPKPTAILVINDYIALDAIQYAKQQKLKINKDICFVSYANLPITHYLETPPMASVEQFPYKQGAKAAEVLMQLMANDNKKEEPGSFLNIVINGQLIVHSRR